MGTTSGDGEPSTIAKANPDVNPAPAEALPVEPCHLLPMTAGLKQLRGAVNVVTYTKKIRDICSA